MEVVQVAILVLAGLGCLLIVAGQILRRANGKRKK